MLVAAAATGALSMFGILAITGMVSGFGSDADTTTRNFVSIPAQVQRGTMQSIVAVRVDGPDSIIRSAGLVVDDSGHIVTSASGLHDGATVTVDSGENAWSEVEIVGIDDATNLAVIRVRQPATLKPVTVSEPDMGAVSLVQAGSDGTAIGESQVANTNEVVTMGDISLIGAVIISTDQPAADATVAMNDRGAAVALPTYVDDDPDDLLIYAVPAQTAVRVGHDIARRGHSSNVSLGIEATPADNHGVRVSALTVGGPADPRASRQRIDCRPSTAAPSTTSPVCSGAFCDTTTIRRSR